MAWLRRRSAAAGSIEHAVDCALLDMALKHHRRTIPVYLATLAYFGYLAVDVGRPALAGLIGVGAMLVAAWRIYLPWRHGRTGDKSVAALSAARHAVEFNALLSGLLWVVCTVGVFPFLSGLSLGCYLGIVSTAVTGSVFFLSPVGRAFEILAVLQVLSVVAVCLSLGASYLPLAVLTLVCGLAVYRAARLYRNTAARAIRSGMEAQQASRAADLANRTKTQFFAAASHDLRQPLHAMGLFAHALLQRRHDPETKRLALGIAHSVEDLDKLFSELLDVNRLDVGAVAVEMRDFVLDDLFRKLQLSFGPVAQDKGLSLRLRVGAHRVHSDPLLVERILRNLVANALRYTWHGGVVVCARRRGAAVLLQVWDTGVGIPVAEQARVFEAFYQVPQHATTDSRKGLGLGLSIVNRFARLLHVPLELRSQEGRGTVFTLTLPVARGPLAVTPPMLPAHARSIGGLEGRLCWLGGEGPDMRLVAQWLTGWGVEVVRFDTTELETDAEVARSPDLLIVDEGPPGRAHLGAWRRGARRAVPAIVLGSSGGQGAPETLGWQVLAKPLAPHKLRALVRSLLA
jgi:signal transduction histidine kinase